MTSLRVRVLIGIAFVDPAGCTFPLRFRLTRRETACHSRCRPRLCRILDDVTLRRDTSEENGADQFDGLLTRREVLKRLALVGVTAPPVALIAACSRARIRPSRRRRRHH
jgi:hypothetical protein